jgi:hypothetical protein
VEVLHISGLALSGLLPPEWTASTSFPLLRELELSNMPGLTSDYTSLHDWLLPKAARMERLVLSGLGGLEGSGLDPMYGSFTNLTALVLSNMNFGGPVPAAWASLPVGKLWVLDLSGNNLSGSLPDWAVGVMTPPPLGATLSPLPPGLPFIKGWLLDLSHNNFTGALGGVRLLGCESCG